MSIQHKIDSMPAYVYDSDQPGVRYFLSFNRDIQGRWSAAYMEYEHHTATMVAADYPTLEDAIDDLMEQL